MDHVSLYHLMALAVNMETTPAVRAVASLKLSELGDYLRTMGERIQEPEQRAHYMYGAGQITLFEESPDQVKLTKPLEPPMGPPI